MAKSTRTVRFTVNFCRFQTFRLVFFRLRAEASVHQIARTLSAAKTVQMVHLLAYRNGDGRTKAGVKLIGSSVIGVRFSSFSFFFLIEIFFVFLLVTRSSVTSTQFEFSSSTFVFE